MIGRLGAKGVRVVAASHFAEGGRGALELAREVVRLCDEPSGFRFVYQDDMSLWDKMKAIATKIYHASDVTADAKVRAQIKTLQDNLDEKSDPFYANFATPPRGMRSRMSGSNR